MNDKMIADGGIFHGRHLSSVIRRGKSLLIRESNGETHEMAFVDVPACIRVVEQLHYSMETGRPWKFGSGPVPFPTDPETLT